MSFREETLYSNNETANSKQIEVLKKHFPQCFDKEGHFIQDKMLETIKANDIDVTKESYSLNWLGKSYARLLTNLPPNTLLTEDKAHNQLTENKNSQNLLIKGDNLEVLKHMVNAYSEKVKMIYIDPPYNTGSDGFVYNDDKKFTATQLSDLANIDFDEAERILEFTTSNSNSHSAWLTFMYPRLYIARELLKDDGVIFISIDDNEVSQLKLLCDEIFGEYNFIACFSWQKFHSVKSNSAHNISTSHEYILCFAKNVALVDFNKMPMSEDALKVYKNIDDDPRGLWRTAPLTVSLLTGSRGESYKRTGKSTGLYEITSPSGRKYLPSSGRCWIAESSVEKLRNDNRIWWGKNGDAVPMQKIFLLEKGGVKSISTFWLHNEYGSNKKANEELKKLFPENSGDNTNFPTPKPTSLIGKIIEMVGSSDKKDVFLDFFAGSGTTGHAIMDLNSLDGGRRKYILVQIEETIDSNHKERKALYKTIFDITKARIEKAAIKIQAEHPEYQGDLGFKIFETVEDFRRDNSELTVDNLSFFDDAMLTDEQYQSLLTTWVLYDGSLLTDIVNDIQLEDYKAHYCNGRLYCLNPDFSTNALKCLLLKLDDDADFSPHKVVLYGNNFDSAKQRELSEAIKGYANKKSLLLDIVVRN